MSYPSSLRDPAFGFTCRPFDPSNKQLVAILECIVLGARQKNYRVHGKPFRYYTNHVRKFQLSSDASDRGWFSSIHDKHSFCSITALPYTVDRRNGKHDGKNLRADHVVPLKVIYDVLSGLDNLSPEITYRVLEELCEYCVILKSEDAKLLRDRMPDGWKYGDDVWARYRFVEPAIQIITFDYR